MVLSTALLLFVAGILTILLPCILPLLPIVLGVSVAGRNKWRPLAATGGMVVGFVVIVFVLNVLLRQFPAAADTVRLATFQILFLFGVGFTVSHARVTRILAALSGLFFLGQGWIAIAVACAVGLLLMEVGGRIAGRVQQLGSDLQRGAAAQFGSQSLFTAFCIGLTMGFVWVPCAGPALGFVFALVREQPGTTAFFLVAVYAIGAAIPLLLVGYGGQLALHFTRTLRGITGIIERLAGITLIVTAVALRLEWFTTLQTWFVENTSYGIFGTVLEERIVGGRLRPNNDASSSVAGVGSELPRIMEAREFSGLGPWHNSAPFTLASLRGKVVLVDFWTYSCINCIRTLPFIEGYWQKFKGTGKFTLIGVHTPEFAFEQNQRNVAEAIKRHGLTYPVAQDNQYGTWNAFANRYWPAKYLIDAEGVIRYAHFGEGAYEETQKAIASLIKEAGVSLQEEKSVTSNEPFDRAQDRQPATSNRSRSPETYLGSRSWNAFGNAAGDPSTEVIMYSAPERMEPNTYYLVGQWQLKNDEMQVLQSDIGEIRMRFLGGEANLVLGNPVGGKVTADVFIDGKKTKTITVDRHDLFNLYSGPYGEHDLRLVIHGKGLEGYAFTFGS